jgi:hypothetical protein
MLKTSQKSLGEILCGLLDEDLRVQDSASINEEVIVPDSTFLFVLCDVVKCRQPRLYPGLLSNFL